jgi:hypothetical protein
MMPSNLNLACRLVLAHRHDPQLLDNPERLREMTGLDATSNAEILGVVSRIIKGLQDMEPERGQLTVEGLK